MVNHNTIFINRLVYRNCSLPHMCECILCCNTLTVHDKSLYITIKVYFLPSAFASLMPCYVSHGTYIPVLSAKMCHPQHVGIRISLVLHWLLSKHRLQFLPNTYPVLQHFPNHYSSRYDFHAYLWWMPLWFRVSSLCYTIWQVQTG